MLYLYYVINDRDMNNNEILSEVSDEEIFGTFYYFGGQIPYTRNWGIGPMDELLRPDDLIDETIYKALKKLENN
jgi:hypothetical protein